MTRRVLALAVAGLLTAGSTAALQRLDDDDPTVTAAGGVSAFVPADVTTTVAAPTTVVPPVPADVPPTTQAPPTSATTAPPPPPPTTAPPAPARISPTTRAPIPPTTPTTIPAQPTSACPGVAPAVNAYGIYVADPAGLTRKVAELSGDVEVNQLGWSPDGKLVAFSTRQGALEGTTTISVAARDGLSSRTIVQGADVDGRFAWAADSRRLVFARRDPTTVPNQARLLVADTTTGAARELFAGTDWITPLAVAGNRVLFDHAGHLWVVDLQAGGPHRIADRASSDAQLSPDGKLLAYVHGGSLVVVDIAAERVVTSGLGGRAGHSAPVRWSPDGTLLTYYQAGGDREVIVRPDGIVIRPSGGVGTRFSPDGHRYVARTIVTEAGRERARLDFFDLRGQGAAAGIRDAAMWDWAPGRTLAAVVFHDVLHTADGNAAVCLSDGPGTTPRRLVTFLGTTIASGVSWSPDGSHLAIKVSRS